MIGSVLSRSVAAGMLLLAIQNSNAQDISSMLKLELTLNKREVRVGEQLAGRFTITNVGKKDLSVVTIGWLYIAYWFRVEGREGRVRAETLFEKLFTDYISREDVVTLKPGQSFAVDRKGKVQRSASKPGKAFIDFGDSGFNLDCGKRYRVYGRFWARDDRSGPFKVISGDLTSAPLDLSIAPCE